jgi:hypothetical protein
MMVVVVVLVGIGEQNKTTGCYHLATSQHSTLCIYSYTCLKQLFRHEIVGEEIKRDIAWS